MKVNVSGKVVEIYELKDGKGFIITLLQKDPATLIKIYSRKNGYNLDDKVEIPCRIYLDKNGQVQFSAIEKR